MPKAFIPFQGIRPDAGLFANQELVYSHGLVPFSGRLVCESPGAAIISAASLFSPLGMAYIGESGVVFAMTDLDASPNKVKIYVMTGPERTVNEIGRDPSTAPYSLDLFWRFQTYGNWLIGTNTDNGIQRIDLTGDLTTTYFTQNNVTTAPTGSTTATGNPRAKFVVAVKNHIVLANCDLTVAVDNDGVTQGGAYGALAATKHSNLVWISALDDPSRFADPDTHPMIIGSDYQQLLDDYGSITAAVGGEDGYFFKEQAIYHMEGPPWTFTQITNQFGTLFPNSVIRVGNDIYFWSKAGPAVISGGTVTVLGDQFIQNFLRNGLDPYLPWYRLNGTALTRFDEHYDDTALTLGGAENWLIQSALYSDWNTLSFYIQKATVVWDEDLEEYVIEFDGSGLTLNYNYVEKTWSYSKLQTPPNVEDLAEEFPKAVLISPIGLPDVSDLWAPGGFQACAKDGGLAMWYVPEDRGTLITMNSWWPFSRVLLGTGYIQLDEESETVIQRIRPIVEYSTTAYKNNVFPTVRVYIDTTNEPNKPFSYMDLSGNFNFIEGNYSIFNDPVNVTGSLTWIPMQDLVAGDYHRITIQFGGVNERWLYVTRFVGIEVQFKKVTRKPL